MYAMQNFKTRIFLISIFILFVSQGILFAQVPSIQWQKCLGNTGTDQIFALILTGDGGYAAAGIFNFGNVWVLKLDVSGNIRWQKILNSTLGEGDACNCIIQTADRGFIIAAQGFTPCQTGNRGGRDAWIVKFDSLGNQEWEKCFGGTDYDGARSIIQTPDHGYIFVGYTGSYDGDVKINPTQSWIVKLDSAGNIKWQSSLGNTNVSTIKPNTIINTRDGGFAVAGSNTWYAQKTGDLCVAKLNSKDSVEWISSFGGSNDDAANSIVETPEGDFVVAGYTESNDKDVSGNNGYRDAWVIKINSLGKLIWQKCIGGSGRDEAFSIVHNLNEGYVFAGESNSAGNGDFDAWVVSLDSLNNIAWQKFLGGSAPDGANAIVKTLDGNYTIAGGTSSLDGDVIGNHVRGDNLSAWVVKLGVASNVQTTFFSSQPLSLSTYPNPATNIITLGYDLPKSSAVGITIYSVTGVRMKEIHEGLVESGHRDAVFDLSGFPDGTYFFSVSACGVTERKMVMKISEP